MTVFYDSGRRLSRAEISMVDVGVGEVNVVNGGGRGLLSSRSRNSTWKSGRDGRVVVHDVG